MHLSQKTTETLNTALSLLDSKTQHCFKYMELLNSVPTHLLFCMGKSATPKLFRHRKLWQQFPSISNFLISKIPETFVLNKLPL